MKHTVTILQSIDSGVDWDAAQRDRFAELMLQAATKAHSQYSWELEWQEFTTHAFRSEGVPWADHENLTEYIYELSQEIWDTGDFWEP